MKELESWQLSPRVLIEYGSHVRFVASGENYSLPGNFEVRRILGKGQRVWLEVWGLTRTGGFYTVFVSGRAYERHGVMWRPYGVKRVKT
jgi:hypothetical protein